MMQGAMQMAFNEMLAGKTPFSQAGAKTEAPQRFQRGSAKPAVLGVLKDHPGGVTAKQAYELLADTGIAENTVRATLNKLKADRDAVKRGERWFIVERPGVNASPTPGTSQGWGTAQRKEA